MKRGLFISTLFILLLLICISVGVQSSKAKIKTKKIKGYITEVHSPTSFEIEDYKIKFEGKYKVELENLPDESIKFNPKEHIKIGTLIKLKCLVNTETLEAKVKEAKIDLKQFRRLSHTVVLHKTPTEINKNEDNSWTGTILTDGRKIIINKSTEVKFKLNKSEKKEKKKKEKGKEKLINKSKDDEFDEEENLEDLLQESKPLESLENIDSGVYMTYKGIENKSGEVIASKVIFVKNEKTKEEAKMWKKLRLKEKPSKKANSFVKLKVGKTKYKVLPEEEIQNYISQLGEKLIPTYQKKPSRG